MSRNGRRGGLELYKATLEASPALQASPTLPEPNVPLLAHVEMARDTMARIERLQRELAIHLSQIESILAGGLLANRRRNT